MLDKLKDLLYFPLAYYFRFFAKIQLARWNPKIIVLTGSSGKTTLLHLVESQLSTNVRYSLHANSAYGIPFDILGLHRHSLTLDEWPRIIISAPFKAFKKPYREHVYVVEADCDRPHEGKFLATLLHPDITVWLSSSRTHSMNFENLINNKKFSSIEEAIAYEFGYFLEYTSQLAIINEDATLIKNQLKRTTAEVEKVTKKDLISYEVTKNGTTFKTKNGIYTFNALLPEEVYYSLAATNLLVNKLGGKLDDSFKNYNPPPARSLIFKGIKNTTIIDSTYNANLESMTAVLRLVKQFPSKTKWGVIGDMLEQGPLEQTEHEKLAQVIADTHFDQIILYGPRVSKYTYPLLKELVPKTQITTFLKPKEVLSFLEINLAGDETILFKGGRLLEGVIEHLLSDQKDATKLARREKAFEELRKQAGL